MVPLPRLNLSFNELFAKMRMAVSFTFQHRVAIYENEIRRLDAAAGTAAYSFRQSYLVKESLALMFQMMQQPENALLQYIEIERSLSLAPRAAHFDTDWPFVNCNSQSDSIKTSSKPPTNRAASSSAAEDGANSGGIASGDQFQLREPLGSKDNTGAAASPREKLRDPWSDVCRLGDELLSYSINQMRMRVLKTRTSTLELHKYVFARQMFFLLLLTPLRLQDYVEKGCFFLRYMLDQLTKKVVFKHTQSQNGSPDASVDGADLAFLRTRWQGNPDVSVADMGPMLLSVRQKQVDLWFICAGVRLIKSFGLVVAGSPTKVQMVSSKELDTDTQPGSPQLSTMSSSHLRAADAFGLNTSECYRLLSDLAVLVCQRAASLGTPLFSHSQLPPPLVSSVHSIEITRHFERNSLDLNQKTTQFALKHGVFERNRLLSGMVASQFLGWYEECPEGSLLERFHRSRSSSITSQPNEQPPIVSQSSKSLGDDGATRTVTVFGSKDKLKQESGNLRKYSKLDLSTVTNVSLLQCV